MKRISDGAETRSEWNAKRHEANNRKGQDEDGESEQTQPREDKENPTTNDWALIWKQQYGNPAQRLIIKGDDEWKKSIPQEGRGRKRTAENSDEAN